MRVRLIYATVRLTVYVLMQDIAGMAWDNVKTYFLQVCAITVSTLSQRFNNR